MQLRVRELGGSLVSLGCNYCLYNPRNAGICAFTSRDIERGEVVVEYDGERVEMEEAARREEKYTEEGRSCTLMVIKRARQQVV